MRAKTPEQTARERRQGLLIVSLIALLGMALDVLIQGGTL